MIAKKHSSTRGALLATVSAVAITMAIPGHLLAADLYAEPAVPFEPSRFDAANEVWVAVEGRYNMFTDSLFGELDPGYGPGLDADPDDGWSGVLELGARPAGSQFDFVGRLVYGQADGEDDFFDSYSGYYGSGYAEAEASVEEDHILADFEVGRHIGVGNTRIHAGLRFAHFDADINGDAFAVGSYYGPYATAFSANERITAIGPRIGIDQRIPITGGLSADLSAAGAVLFGERKTDASISGYGIGYGPYSDNNSESEGVTVWNAEASAALTYAFGNAEASLGYRVDAFWDLYETPEGDNGDRITHGPFVKLKVNFGG